MGDGSGYAAAAYKPMQQQTCMHVGGHMAGQQQQQQLNQQDSSAGYAVQDSHDAYGGGMGSGHEGEEGMAGGATASGGAEGAAAGQKRVRAEGEEDQQTKRQHQEPEEEIPEPDCHYCAQLVKTGRKKVRAWVSEEGALLCCSEMEHALPRHRRGKLWEMLLSWHLSSRYFCHTRA